MLKVHNEKVEFQKAKCLVKTVKKCIMKKLSVWLALIKVAVWEINYQKKNNVHIREFISYLNQLLHILTKIIIIIIINIYILLILF